MKKLILTAVLFVAATSTSIVSAQTYPTPQLKSLNKTVMIQRTSETTLTLKFENVNGYVVTEYLKNRSKTGDVVTYTGGDGCYVKLWPTALNFTGYVSYEIEYYNSLGRRIWYTRVTEVL